MNALCRTLACGALVAVGLALPGCDEKTVAPTPLTNSLEIRSVTPASGGVVTLPPEWAFYQPGGVVIPQGSGHLSVAIAIQSAHFMPWAQLNVYLLTGGTTTEYCGQNTPDSPTWGSLPDGWATNVTISGFRVYRLPCSVTGIRAMFHTRNNGNMTPPIASETIAEAVYPVSFQIRQ